MLKEPVPITQVIEIDHVGCDHMTWRLKPPVTLTPGWYTFEIRGSEQLIIQGIASIGLDTPILRSVRDLES